MTKEEAMAWAVRMIGTGPISILDRMRIAQMIEEKTGHSVDIIWEKPLCERLRQ